MRRFLIACAAALAVTAAQEQKASAWCNFNFSAGVNLSWQAGDNCYLWGLCKTGPYPGTQAQIGNCSPFGHCGQNCWNGNCGGNGFAYGGGSQYLGGYPVTGDTSVLPAPTQSTTPAPAPTPNPGVAKPQQTTQQIGYYSYPGDGYYSYPTAGYAYTGYYGNSYYQAPSYWYGN